MRHLFYTESMTISIMVSGVIGISYFGFSDIKTIASVQAIVKFITIINSSCLPH